MPAITVFQYPKVAGMARSYAGMACKISITQVEFTWKGWKKYEETA